MNVSNPYRGAEFLTSVNELSRLPPDHGREVAFAGRSNAGKSSALNRLTGQKRLARISKTPGRTQMINFFTIAPERYLVDLPGYGYAKVPAAMRNHWRRTLEGYLSTRRSLSGLILLMDVRHPLTPLDTQMLDWSHHAGLGSHVLLTKADKLKRGAAGNMLLKVRAALSADHPQATVQLFSANDGRGTDEALTTLNHWLFGSDDGDAAVAAGDSGN